MQARLQLCTLIYNHMPPCSLQGAVNFKFGVLYAKAGQKTDNEMFSNGEQLLIEKPIITPQIKQLALKMP